MKKITDISQLNLNAVYTYADYLTWHFEQTVELIKGKLFKMSPAPKTNHQRISRNLNEYFISFFKKNACEFFYAPFDVRLPDKRRSDKADTDIYTVVQPDLVIICDTTKIDERGCLGAPDLVVEILSKGNSRKEMRTKYQLYQESGVREYWIADPERQTIHVFYANEHQKYQLHQIFLREDVLHSAIFPDLKINLTDVFPEQEDEF